MKRKTKPKPTVLSLRRELPPSEYDVCLCMLRGAGLVETARALSIPESTAFDRRKAVLVKAGAETQAELLALVLLPFIPERLRMEIGVR